MITTEIKAMVFGTEDNWWCLKDHTFTRLSSLAALCLRLQVALAKDSGSCAVGGFVVGGEEEKGSPAPGPHPRSPALISLGVQWVWESEPPSPPSFGGTVGCASTAATQLFWSAKPTAMSLLMPPRASENLPQHHVSSTSIRLLVVTNSGVFYHFLGCVRHCSLLWLHPVWEGFADCCQ